MDQPINKKVFELADSGFHCLIPSRISESDRKALIRQIESLPAIKADETDAQVTRHGVGPGPKLERPKPESAE